MENLLTQSKLSSTSIEYLFRKKGISLVLSVVIVLATMISFMLLNQNMTINDSDPQFLFLFGSILIVWTLLTIVIYYAVFSLFIGLSPTHSSQKSISISLSEEIAVNPTFLFLQAKNLNHEYLILYPDIMFFVFIHFHFSLLSSLLEKLMQDFLDEINLVSVFTEPQFRKIKRKFKRGCAALAISNLIILAVLLFLFAETDLLFKICFLAKGIYNLLKIVEIYSKEMSELQYVEGSINKKESLLYTKTRTKFIFEIVTTAVVFCFIFFLYVKGRNMKYYFKVISGCIILLQLIYIVSICKNFIMMSSYYFTMLNSFPKTKRVNDECIICTEKLENGRWLKCNHCFHFICLMSWIERGNQGCPVCRKTITQESGIRKVRIIESDGIFQFIRGMIPNVL